MAKRTKAAIITAVATMTEPIDIFFATGNAHKVGEMQALADDSKLALRLRSAKEAGGMPAVAEDTFHLGPLMDSGVLLLGRSTWEMFAAMLKTLGTE